jgi:predicted RNase H-like HicB family nuclease
MGSKYLGVVEKDAHSAWGIWFPDLPGCLPAADEFDDLPRIASELLRQHIEALKSNSRPVPVSRPVAEVMHDEDVRKALKAGAMTILAG